MGNYLDDLNRRLRLVKKPDYVRPKYNSYMSGPEWRNVEIEREFAEMLRNSTSMFQFPFFRQAFDLWKVVFNSYSAARKYDRSMDIMTSEYMVMDVFVAFFTTMELLPKGLLSLMLRPFLNEINETEMQKHLSDYFTQYALDLETIPFYDQKYAQTRANLAQAYREANDKTWGDWFSWKCVSTQLFARHWLSKPLHAWFHSEDNIVPPTTEVLVKCNIEGDDNDEDAKQKLLSRLNNLNGVDIVKEHVYVKPNQGKGHTSTYALLRAHRYAAFQQDIKAMTDMGVEVRYIAGQEQVQVKCEVNTDNAATMQQRVQELKHVPNARMLYTYGDRIHAGRQICMFDVPVKQLQKTVAELNEQKDVKVKFIHNF